MAPSSGLHVRAGMGATYPRSYDLHGKMTRARARATPFLATWKRTDTAAWRWSRSRRGCSTSVHRSLNLARTRRGYRLSDLI